MLFSRFHSTPQDLSSWSGSLGWGCGLTGGGTTCRPRQRRCQRRMWSHRRGNNPSSAAALRRIAAHRSSLCLSRIRSQVWYSFGSGPAGRKWNGTLAGRAWACPSARGQESCFILLPPFVPVRPPVPGRGLRPPVCLPVRPALLLVRPTCLPAPAGRWGFPARSPGRASEGSRVPTGRGGSGRRCSPAGRRR